MIDSLLTPDAKIYLQYFIAPVITAVLTAALGHWFKSRQDRIIADTKYQHQYYEAMLQHRIDAYLKLQAFVTKYLQRNSSSSFQSNFAMRDLESWETVFDELNALIANDLWYTDSTNDALNSLTSYIGSVSNHFRKPKHLELAQLQPVEQYARKLQHSISLAFPTLGDIDEHFKKRLDATEQKVRSPFIADEIAGWPRQSSPLGNSAVKEDRTD